MVIAFDFDGVIHKYTKGWQDGSIYDDLFKEWALLAKRLLKNGHHVFILSTRPKRQIYKHLKKLYYDNTPSATGLPCANIWTCGFGFRIIRFWEKFYKTKTVDSYSSVGICNHKAVFDILIDDRVICFNGDYKNLREKITNFKPWGEKNE